MTPVWLCAVGCAESSMSAPVARAPSAMRAQATVGAGRVCSDRALTMWVSVDDGPGECRLGRQCVTLGGRHVQVLVVPADSCGYAAATWTLRNCESASVVFGTLTIAPHDSPGGWQYDFAEQFARVPPGEVRRRDLVLQRAGRYDAETIVTRNGVAERMRASFEIPTPTTIIEGPERCDP